MSHGTIKSPLLTVAIAGLLLVLSGCTAASNAKESTSPSASKYTVSSVTNSNDGTVSDKLVREKDADAVLAQHLKALNGCDWAGLLAQYPDQAEIRLTKGATAFGRQKIADLFAGFVLPPAKGGLCGLTFKEESRMVTGGTIAVQWVADAPFLAEPYRGSDAYITDDGLMVGMVTTFDGAELKMK